MTPMNRSGAVALRGALLGTGPISIHHMIAWQAIPEVKSVALENRTRAKAEAMGQQFGIADSHIYADQGIHYIDTMRFLFGKIERMYARLGHASPLVAGDAILEFQNGVTGVIDISYASRMSGNKKGLIRGNVDPFIVEGDMGTIELDPYEDDTVIVATVNAVERHSARPGMTPAEGYQESFINTQRHFVECLRSGKPAQNELDDNLQMLAATCAAYESAAQRQIVTLGAA